MNAGRELDALIATKVMGWTICDTADYDKAGIAPGQTWSAIRVPHYSTDIAAAWEVVKKIDLFAGAVLLGSDSRGWRIIEDGQELGDTIAEAATAPLVICLAALKRVEQRENPPPPPRNIVHLLCDRKMDIDVDHCSICREFVCRTCYPDHEKSCVKKEGRP